MKRFVVVGAFFLALLWQTGFAQMKDAQLMIGGGLGASYTANSARNMVSGFAFGLYPSVGVFVTDRLVLGGQVNASYNSLVVEQNPMLSQVNLGLAPLVRYFWSDLASPFVGFSQLSGGGNYTWYYQDGVMGSMTTFGFRATAATGVSWFVVPNVGIEAALQYTYATSTPVYLQFVVGVQAYISRK
jgi:hypothetical protein